ncbi:iron ABC transporter permease [Hoyosella rhizosphaerae]|uniref:Iron ABC transporter permease n=1 Tax=Hoyosella rhizosphaerae TaxID=1755582 RepID=A0A916X8R1_9ACTN|nr:iron ABC transporter permease [Hoyosella rhizosphaerae]MBN4926949.1 iron ABC transporter permease [Hoyosella rhizosphaerae]GGC55238.1 iron ABC transporter permease [Hoyosella rhizosphaerae]
MVDTLTRQTNTAATSVVTEAARGAVKRRLAIIAAALSTIVVLLISICTGAYWIPLGDVVRVVAGGLGLPGGGDSTQETVIWNIRMPRTLLAAAVGAALAASGTAFQGTFRNPLVEPYILGVSAGAACGAGMSVLLNIPLSMQLSAFIMGTLAVALAAYFARGRESTTTIVLSGVIVGSFFMSIFALFQYFGSDAQLRRLVFWVLGGFYTARWDDVWLVLPATILGAAALWALAWRLNLLTLGDQECRSLGVNPAPTRRAIVLIATALTALAVSVAGIIAWVGLLIPHAARMIVGADNRAVVPLSIFLGASFMMMCDSLARTLHSGELPIGIITAAIGAPFLIMLLRRKSTSWGT